MLNVAPANTRAFVYLIFHTKCDLCGSLWKWPSGAIASHVTAQYILGNPGLVHRTAAPFENDSPWVSEDGHSSTNQIKDNL